MPWLHLDDAVGLALRALDDGGLAGAVNAVAPRRCATPTSPAPSPAPCARPAFLPLPAPAVRLALGEIAGELLASRRVVPARAQAAGYAFAYPELAPALAAELGR